MRGLVPRPRALTLERPAEVDRERRETAAWSVSCTDASPRPRPLGAGALFIAEMYEVVESLACPSCPTSRVVAAIVCGDDLWKHLAATVAPFPLFALLALGLRRLARAPETS